MKIATASSTEADSIRAIEAACESLRNKLGNDPDLLFIQSSVTYDSEKVLAELSRLMPEAKIHGGTSCLGSMTEDGFFSSDGRGLSVLGLSDPDGGYGVGASPIDGESRKAASRAVIAALEDAGRPGELPDLIRLTSPPGTEEAIILGIEDILGPNVPIIGGSSADNTVEGRWKQFANGSSYTDAVVIGVLFPSVETAFAFHSGYTPTETSGVATRAEGRILYEIDNQAAAEVYNRWTGGTVDTALADGGNVLALTTLHPVGREVGEVQGMPYYRLSHPDSVTPDKALTLFSDINEGDRLILMNGSRESLVSRAGRVAEAAMEAGSFTADTISGALVVYCAGCMLTVQEDMERVVNNINQSLSGHPFQGAFTFGEQGCFVGGENRHGNLMISVVVFGK